MSYPDEPRIPSPKGTGRSQADTKPEAIGVSDQFPFAINSCSSKSQLKRLQYSKRINCLDVCLSLVPTVQRPCVVLHFAGNNR
jgi:hypothetical protein